jgi:ornithine cyclodeaminase/alanine dehydrogenase-like protein (mu-crystallin family)
LTLVLSERDVSGLIDMKETVAAVEDSFRRQAEGRAVNSPRTRSAVPGSVLNVMHASLPYLGRAGVKLYLGTKTGTKFLFVLLDLSDASPLAIMGADLLGRYRTGAASAVATKFLCGANDFRLSVYGSGRQALTQVTALATVAKLTEVAVWSPNRDHAKRFVDRLRALGFVSSAAESPLEAARSSDVGSAMTSSKEPFLTAEAVENMRHLNLCGSNAADRAEARPDAVATFKTVVVDDIGQAKEEAGDLILAARAGAFDWGNASELKDFVARRVRPAGRTLFKSTGVALEDVAVASLVYDKAAKSRTYAELPVNLAL